MKKKQTLPMNDDRQIWIWNESSVKRCFIFAGLYLLMQFSPYILRLILPMTEDTKKFLWSYGDLIFYSMLFAAGLLLFRRELWQSCRHFWDNKKQMFKGLIGCYFVSFAAVFGWIFLVINPLDIPLGGNEEGLREWAERDPMIMLVTAAVLGPLVEELIFRGLIFGILDKTIFKKSKPFVAIIISSVIFGLIHMDALTLDELIGATQQIVGGLVLGAYYARTKNILVTYGAHMAWNFTITMMTS